MSTSIVVVSRNDGYGGNLHRRAELALNTMIDHYDEVVYVDWCSPAQSLANEINLKQTGKFRHIQVKHKDLVYLGRVDLIELPIVEVMGRNIGIRRATGDWIVSSNVDIMPSRLFKTPLDTNKMYTCQRRNVPPEYFLREEFNYNYALNYASEFRLLGEVDDGFSLVSCCGDYQSATSDLWHKMRGFEEGMIFRDAADSNVMKKGLIYGDGTGILHQNIFHLDHTGHGETAGVLEKNSWYEWVINFTETRNPETWGFANYAFEEEII